jgi:cobyrinic acid a,c-diamide synthase
LLDALDRQEIRIQTFMHRSCLACMDGTSTITGVAPRHLDSWLMPPDVCRQAFVRGSRHCDLAVVEGNLSGAESLLPGGHIEPLCDWLGLPRLGILNVRGLSGCRLPGQGLPLDAVLLDGVASASDFYRWQTAVETLCGLPVLGALEETPIAREIISRLQPGQKPARELCRALGDQMVRYLQTGALLRLAEEREFPAAPQLEDVLPATPLPFESTKQRAEFAPAEQDSRYRRGLTVAIAYDEVFNGYFPDTLEVLEQRGVKVRDFSTLHDESLPPDCDIVYIGCGYPARHAAELSENQCLFAALREHVCAGRRVYAEGGGMAYLCQHLALPDGLHVPMAGVLPAVAHLSPHLRAPEPIELTLPGTNWLGRPGQRLRGYLNGNWRLEPRGPLGSYLGQSANGCEMIERHQAIGSRVHVNLAAQPTLLESFLQPCPAALDWAAAR